MGCMINVNDNYNNWSMNRKSCSCKLVPAGEASIPDLFLFPLPSFPMTTTRTSPQVVINVRVPQSIVVSENKRMVAFGLSDHRHMW